jgi:hypothetical protein
MYLCKLFIIIFCHPSLAILQFPYPKQTFELPNHPSNWVCTVHVTVATFANYTSSDITERFLTSNREKIIPTLSTMLNRTISIDPVISFFEPCTISILIDATIRGSSYVYRKNRVTTYTSRNAYAYRGWRHSLIILIDFSCYSKYDLRSQFLPYRLFHHSLDCGYQNIFPNQVFVHDPLQNLRDIADQTHSIHFRQLPLAVRRSIPTPKYGWDGYDLTGQDKCLGSRLAERSQMYLCDINQLAVQQYQHLMNFTAVANTPVHVPNFGMLFTNTKFHDFKDSMLLHAIDSMNSRVLYCDRNSDSPRLRPLILSSPFSFETWVTLVFLLIFCAIVHSFTIFNMRALGNNPTIIFIKAIFNSLFELIICMLEKDIGTNNCTKTFIGLIVICLGNTYKNYLTIELVFPRAQDAISNFTELLDLNFNSLEPVTLENIGNDKLAYLKELNYHMEIDETKREKYLREVERWLKFITDPGENLINELASVTSKNAWITLGSDYTQVHALNIMTQRNYPLSCHFVKRPFAHRFSELYFINPKAEDFKSWTAKFLDHGLFVFWKRLHSHSVILYQRRESLQMRSHMSNSSSAEALDISNFIGQVHLIVVYIVISVLTAICVAIFLLECAMRRVREVSLFVLSQFTHFSLQLLWTIIRFFYLMSRLIGRIYESRNPS